jgi:hypothetical protein
MALFQAESRVTALPYKIVDAVILMGKNKNHRVTPSVPSKTDNAETNHNSAAA